MTELVDMGALGDRLVYAVGDIHGRHDLLLNLLEVIVKDASGAPYELIFLGDYVDRGPESAGVLSSLSALEDQAGPLVKAVAGNHERLLLAFLERPDCGAAWMEIGGAETLASYGVRVPRNRSDPAGWTAAAQDLAAALPTRHLKFLNDLRAGFRSDRFVFVHAGVRPGVALEQQTPHDLCTIRQSFLRSAYPAGDLTVVYGHTPVEEVLFSSGKIGVDTGAYASGVLSGLRIAAHSLRVLDTRGRNLPLFASGGAT